MVLRQDGRTATNEKPITPWMLYSLIACEALVGNFLWGREGHGRRRSESDANFSRITVCIEPIISAEVWAAAKRGVGQFIAFGRTRLMPRGTNDRFRGSGCVSRLSAPACEPEAGLRIGVRLSCARHRVIEAVLDPTCPLTSCLVIAIGDGDDPANGRPRSSYDERTPRCQRRPKK
jgi:hypothetical protein